MENWIRWRSFSFPPEMAFEELFEHKRVVYVFAAIAAAGFDVDRDIGGSRRIDETSLFAGLHQTMDLILDRDRNALSLLFEETTRPQGHPSAWIKDVYMGYLNGLLEKTLGLKIKRDLGGYGLFDELAGMFGGPGQPPHPGWPRIPSATTAA